MPWSTSRPRGQATAAKYASAAHRREVKAHREALAREGFGTCAEKVCKMGSRVITPGMALDLCHDRVTGAVLGLGHRGCNQAEAGRYARARQTSSALRW